LKEAEPVITLDFLHFVPDIDHIMGLAGLSRVDVSSWKPEDFDEPSCSSESQIDVSSWSSNDLKDPNEGMSQVDVSSWGNNDFSSPPSTSTKVNESLSCNDDVFKVPVSTVRLPLVVRSSKDSSGRELTCMPTSSALNEVYTYVDVSNWTDVDFTQK